VVCVVVWVVGRGGQIGGSATKVSEQLHVHCETFTQGMYEEES
jgi:hypothetical protein